MLLISMSPHLYSCRQHTTRCWCWYNICKIRDAWGHGVSDDVSTWMAVLCLWPRCLPCPMKYGLQLYDGQQRGSITQWLRS
jgi:hypothetical protein